MPRVGGLIGKVARRLGRLSGELLVSGLARRCRTTTHVRFS